MLKGVNRQVIEVIETGSRYFERALLVVKPNTGARPEQIYDEAARFFSGAPAAPRKGRVLATAAKLTGSAAAGAIIATLITSALR